MEIYLEMHPFKRQLRAQNQVQLKRNRAQANTTQMGRHSKRRAVLKS